mmetsp:Transcript_4625/g.11208  ORF Transcript_4625/g.11208 Transcript_4625/m.11208 type:complete len:260 (-) Transcript_4625:342-1121(-)
MGDGGPQDVCPARGCPEEARHVQPWSFWDEVQDPQDFCRARVRRPPLGRRRGDAAQPLPPPPARLRRRGYVRRVGQRHGLRLQRRVRRPLDGLGEVRTLHAAGRLQLRAVLPEANTGNVGIPGPDHLAAGARERVGPGRLQRRVSFPILAVSRKPSLEVCGAASKLRALPTLASRSDTTMQAAPTTAAFRRRTLDYLLFMNSKVLFRTVRKDDSMKSHVPVSVHVNYHNDKHQRMKAVIRRYVKKELSALDEFPDGSVW